MFRAEYFYDFRYNHSRFSHSSGSMILLDAIVDYLESSESCRILGRTFLQDFDYEQQLKYPSLRSEEFADFNACKEKMERSFESMNDFKLKTGFYEYGHRDMNDWEVNQIFIDITSFCKSRISLPYYAVDEFLEDDLLISDSDEAAARMISRVEVLEKFINGAESHEPPLLT